MITLSVQTQELLDRAERAIERAANLRAERTLMLSRMRKSELELELTLWRKQHTIDA